jgi:hypothetical protein
MAPSEHSETAFRYFLPASRLPGERLPKMFSSIHSSRSTGLR